MDLKESNNNTGTRHPWELSRFLISQDLLKRNLKTNGSFVDIGSGDLFFSKEFCKQHQDTEGYAIDIAFPDDLIADVNGDENISLKAFKSLDQAEKEISKPVSIIFLMDILEHIENDKSFLTDLIKRKFISKDTLFFITVPAFQSLFCSHDVFLEHYRRYNNRQLKKLLVESGLKVNSIGYFYTSLIAPRIVKVIIEKLRKTTDADYSQLNHWEHGKTITTLVKTFLQADFYLSKLFRKLGIKLPGLSNYAVCRISV